MNYSVKKGLLKSIKKVLLFVGGFLGVIYVQEPVLILSLLEKFIAPTSAVIVVTFLGFFFNYLKNGAGENGYELPGFFE